MTANNTKGRENVPEPAVRYHFSKKLGCWVRTWFTVERGKDGDYFQQHNAFAKNRDTDWLKWQSKPIGKQ